MYCGFEPVQVCNSATAPAIHFSSFVYLSNAYCFFGKLPLRRTQHNLRGLAKVTFHSQLCGIIMLLTAQVLKRQDPNQKVILDPYMLKTTTT